MQHGMTAAVFGVCCAIVGMGGCSSGGNTDAQRRQVLATVDDMPNYANQLRKRLGRLRVASNDGLPAAAGAHAAQKRSLLESMIERRLLLREAERANILVNSTEVKAAYKAHRSGWPQGRFRAILKKQGRTVAELKRDIRELLLIRKYFEEEVFARVAVTDSEIRAYIQSHPEVAVEPEKVRARQIVVETERKAQMVLSKIGEGEAFEDMAMEYSLTPDGTNGGDLGYFARGTMPAALENECFSLRKGEVSDVVATEYGYHIFQLVDRKDERELSEAQVRAKVERLLRRKKERRAQSEHIRALKEGADIKRWEDRLATLR